VDGDAGDPLLLKQRVVAILERLLMAAAAAGLPTAAPGR
jgi:hypothetical protein